MHKFPGTVNEFGNFVDPYERTLPERFEGDSALDSYPVDKFTQNMIENYAIEGISGQKVKDPKPTGMYYMKKDAAKEVAKEILATHYGLSGADADAYLASHYDDAWNYYDVNKEGKLDAVGMTQSLFRFLCKPLGDLNLQ